MSNFFNFRTDARLSITVRAPEIEMSIIKRLGKPKFWVSNNDFSTVMEKIYKTVSANARKIYHNSKGTLNNKQQ